MRWAAAACAFWTCSCSFPAVTFAPDDAASSGDVDDAAAADVGSDAADPCDKDGDGYKAISCGGNDCNDDEHGDGADVHRHVHADQHGDRADVHRAPDAAAVHLRRGQARARPGPAHRRSTRPQAGRAARDPVREPGRPAAVLTQGGRDETIGRRLGLAPDTRQRSADRRRALRGAGPARRGWNG